MDRRKTVSSACSTPRPAFRAALPLLAAALLLIDAPPARAQDLARGRQIFEFCASCHGPAGGGNREYHAPVIGGLPAWYLEAQLVKFKTGLRGARAEDTAGLQMRPMTRALTHEGDLKDVAAYVATLKPPPPPATVQGNAEQGQGRFAVCLACHGDRGQGNQGIGAPPLAGQADWYLVAQLQKFRQGLRGTDPRDATGAQMRPMAMTLGDDQAIRDVVAYIRTLRR